MARSPATTVAARNSREAETMSWGEAAFSTLCEHPVFALLAAPCLGVLLGWLLG